MKRKRADRADWKRITRSRFRMTRVNAKEYSGYITLLHMDEVEEPLSIELQDQKIYIADRDLSWLQHFPEGAHYTLTTMFNADGEVIQWYIDICWQLGVDEDGVPWYDDLYLDIVVTPDGEIILLDVEELDEALREGKISPLAYDFAWQEADALMLAIEEDMFPLLWLSETHYQQLMQLPG